MDLLKDTPVKLDLEAAIANIKRNGTPNRVYYGLEPGIKQSLCYRFEICKGLDKCAPRNFWPKSSYRSSPVAWCGRSCREVRQQPLLPITAILGHNSEKQSNCKTAGQLYIMKQIGDLAFCLRDVCPVRR